MGETVRLLLVEDNPGDVRLVREALRAASWFEIRHADTLASAVNDLAQSTFDIVLLDLGLPDSRGLDTLREITAAGPTVPVVVLTGQHDEDTGKAAVRQGAQDYLIKGELVHRSLLRVLSFAVERNDARERLRKSEETFRLLFESMADGVVFQDADGQIVSANPAALRILGLTAEQIRGRTSMDPRWRSVREDGSDFAGGHHPAMVALATGRPVHGVVMGVFHPQEEALRWIRVNAIPLRKPEQPRPHGVYTTFQDITDRKRAEDSLREAERQWRTTFDALRDAVALLDAEGTILRYNQAFAALVGVPDPAGRFCCQVVKGRSTPPDQCPHFQAMKSGRREASETVLGKRTWTVTVDPVLDAAGRAIGTVHVLSDITDKKQMQASLAQSDRLANMGMLAAGVAHEINNPLTYVVYNLQSLVDDLPCLAQPNTCVAAGFVEALTSRASEALNGTMRIREIAKGLGAFSRVEDADLSNVDIRVPIQNAINMARNEIRYRARLTIDLPKLPAVRGSEGKLAQVFLNLLVNAAHAIGEGHVDQNLISVRTWADNTSVFAEVVDTGQGIPSSLQCAVFEPFFTTKGPGFGSGLGLSICRTIITGFGGQISVQSNGAKGTQFLVQLPIAVDVVDSQTHRDQAMPAAAHGRILIIDDEVLVRGILEKMLCRDHEVVAAPDGESGLRILRDDQRFDLILCDLMMPSLSGMDVHRWLCDNHSALAAKMVFVTGGAFTPTAKDFLARVGNLRLEKPFDPKTLQRSIAEAIGRHSKPDEGGQ